MGLADAFSAEDRVQLKVSDLMGIMRSDALNWAQNQCLVNGIKAHLPHNHMLIMIGEEPTYTEEAGTMENKEEK